MFHLARQGYGSLAEIEDWDTPRLLDVIEHERIRADIEAHIMEVPPDGRSH